MNNIAASNESSVIVYYISDYGYGHAARSIALIRRILERDIAKNMLLVICGGRSLPFIRKSLAMYEQQIVYRNTQLDLGYITKPGSVELDYSEMKNGYKEYICRFPTLVKQEKEFLSITNADLVISDISPIPFVAADSLNITSVGISNFTWYTAYLELFEDRQLDPLFQAYCKMDYFISLPGAYEPTWGREKRVDVGFYSRQLNKHELSRIKQELDLDRFEKVIFFTAGLAIEDLKDLELLQLWNDPSVAFLVSSTMSIQKDNIFHIPMDYLESQHYVAAADYVITKPGWSTISEAILFEKPLMLIKRSGMREDTNLITALVDQGSSSLEISNWEEFIELDASCYKINKRDKFNADNINIKINQHLDDICLILDRLLIREWKGEPI